MCIRDSIQTVPEEVKTDELIDLTEWLGELVRQVDSSLLDEWDKLRHPEALDTSADALVDLADVAPPPVTANARAFRVMVRNEAFRRVELAARRRWSELGEMDADAGFRATAWEDAFAAYLAEHATIGNGPAARNDALFQVAVSDTDRTWRVRQVIDDPEGFHEWAIVLDIDLAASDDLGAPVVRPIGVERL